MDDDGLNQPYEDWEQLQLGGVLSRKKSGELNSNSKGAVKGKVRTSMPYMPFVFAVSVFLTSNKCSYYTFGVAYTLSGIPRREPPSCEAPREPTVYAHTYNH